MSVNTNSLLCRRFVQSFTIRSYRLTDRLLTWFRPFKQNVKGQQTVWGPTQTGSCLHAGRRVDVEPQPIYGKHRLDLKFPLWTPETVHLTSAFLLFSLLLSADEDASWWIVMSRWDKYVSVRLVANARPPAVPPRPGRTLLHPSGRRNQHGVTSTLWKRRGEAQIVLIPVSLIGSAPLCWPWPVCCFPVNTWTC